jgi:effector-binding domain-containing protein
MSNGAWAMRRIGVDILFSLLAPFVLHSGAAPAPSQIKVVERKAQPYVAICTAATIKEMPGVVPKFFPELLAFLKKHDVTPDGPVFVRFLVIDMADKLQIEVGVPVKKAMKGAEGIVARTIPAGKYVSSHFIGIEYMRANAELQEWAKARHLKFDCTEKGHASHWKSRVEFYIDGPQDEPDPKKWRSEILYKLK